MNDEKTQSQASKHKNTRNTPEDVPPAKRRIVIIEDAPKPTRGRPITFGPYPKTINSK
jgi:hypothetical protein